MPEIMKLVESRESRTDIPNFAPGDTVKVHVKVKEGDKERIQIFQGIVISRKGGGSRQMFTVRKVSGGELPAMLMADAVGRMIEGVVGNSGSVEEDSFFRGLLDYPHYTRPEELRGMRVPEILMSGHHENIRKWRKEQALRATLEKRPDLLETAELDDEAREILRRLRGSTLS